MTDPREPLIPEELSFDRRQLAELLHLLDWLEEVLVASGNDAGAHQTRVFIRDIQARLGWDVDGMTSDPDDSEDQ